MGRDGSPAIVYQAGTGGAVAYARSGVVELGGGLSWSGDSDNNTLAVSPVLGWFAADNLELSLLLQWTRTASPAFAEAENAFSALVEPSYHLPIKDWMFVFGGLGIGVNHITRNAAPAVPGVAVTTPATGTTGFALAPRVGMNFLLGRSGLISPSVTWNTVTTGDSQLKDSNGNVLVALRSRWSLNIAYSVML